MAAIKVLQPNEAHYPNLLKQISDYPQKLWVTGDVSVLNSPLNIAIVGSRESTSYGLSIARRLAQELVSLGFTIVSGMASGIDTAAHEGALEAGGRTVAVFGTGIDMTFPAGNKALRTKIENNGCVMTEFEPGTRGAPWTFPKRNRIISGLSLGVVVVEAGLKSGSLITARMAAEQGREVFAVPGLITSQTSQGSHYLIQGGAKLVTCVQDIVSEFPKVTLKSLQHELPLLAPAQQKIMNLLLQGPLHIDELSSTAGFSVSEASELLLDMEMSGQIKSLPGSRFEIKQGAH